MKYKPDRMQRSTGGFALQGYTTKRPSAWISCIGFTLSLITFASLFTSSLYSQQNLCISGPFTADFNDNTLTFKINQSDAPMCIKITKGGSCKDCRVTPCYCWWGIIGDPTIGPIYSEQIECEASNYENWCCITDPGTYTFTVDVCDGVSFTISCDPNNSCCN